MTEFSTIDRMRRSTPRASLAALGLKLQQLDLFRPIHDQVAIKQKTVRYSPTDKLADAFISLLAGAHGLVEVNTRLRSDPALQHAFGRTGCAEQSVIQQTLCKRPSPIPMGAPTNVPSGLRLHTSLV